MAYDAMTEKKIIGRKNSKPCAWCGVSLNRAVVYQRKYTTFDEGIIVSGIDNTCAKCEYRHRSHEARSDARRGNCPDADFQTKSWSDGSLYGGECQDQCSNCNLLCTRGEVGSF